MRCFLGLISAFAVLSMSGCTSFTEQVPLDDVGLIPRDRAIRYIQKITRRPDRFQSRGVSFTGSFIPYHKLRVYIGRNSFGAYGFSVYDPDHKLTRSHFGHLTNDYDTAIRAGEAFLSLGVKPGSKDD